MRNQESFRNSELDRAKPKRHIFHSLINDNLKRHRSDIGLVEDRTSSVTIVRIIVGLLLLHLIIIGGVLLRGHIVKEGGAGLSTPMAVTPPPANPPAEAPAQDALPKPTAPVDTKPIIASNHITQATATSEDEDAVDPEEEPAPVANAVVATTGTQPVQHLVAAGDGWLSIAAQYGTTEAALKEANPQAARGRLSAGVVLVIPQQSETMAKQAAAAAAAQQAAAKAAEPKMYTVRSGDTLSRISKKTGVPVNTIMEINGLKNANRISVGMQLRLNR